MDPSTKRRTNRHTATQPHSPGDHTKHGVNASENAKPQRAIAHSCGGCDNTWTGTSRAHCGACHRLFSSAKRHALHRTTRGEHGTCLDPTKLRDTNDDPVMEYRNGMWCGPAMSDDDLTRTRNHRSAK